MPIGRNPRLTLQQVKDRLALYANPAVVDELYDFGLTLGQETLEQIKVTEGKANYFAAYGTAIATLLVSSYGLWSTRGNTYSLWIGFAAGFAASICTYHSVGALQLTTLKVISEDDWLRGEVLADIVTLKQYRIVSLWAVLESRIDVQRYKAMAVARSQIWLAGAVAYLAFLLLQLAVAHLFSGWGVGVLNVHQCGRGDLYARCVGLGCGWLSIMICLIGMAYFYRRAQRLTV
jgi:hypothetical protein